MQASVGSILEFLTELFHKGLSYSAVNTAKAAILNFIQLSSGRSFQGDEVILQKFMRGIFTLRPSLPRYGSTWDVSIVLKYLRSQSPPAALTLMALSRKLATLLMLLTGHRGQSIHNLDTKMISCSQKSLILKFGKVVKTSKPGKHITEVVLPAYRETGLCVVTTYKAYLTRTKRFRKTNTLFLSTMRPHGPISRDSFGRWVKVTLGNAGVDLSVYGVHSTRSATTSSVCGAGVPVQVIMRSAGWESDCTFRKFYQRPVTRDTTFADAILHRAECDKQSEESEDTS